MRIEILAAVAAGLSPFGLIQSPSVRGPRKPDESTRAVDGQRTPSRREWMQDRSRAASKSGGPTRQGG